MELDNIAQLQMMLPDTEELSPEKKMLFGILDRAARDLLNPPKLNEDYYKLTRTNSKRKKSSDRILIESLPEWFASDSEEPFSFLFICSYLNIDPVFFHREFLNKNKKLS